ncbi:hypothetical protein HanRHA438_Chr10g0438821 [Helianthus annuus]|nr:hypothetical protein HanRHA438_Chr10g0438821 [Helianthus annuus]
MSHPLNQLLKNCNPPTSHTYSSRPESCPPVDHAPVTFDQRFSDSVTNQHYHCLRTSNLQILIISTTFYINHKSCCTHVWSRV